MKQSIKNTIFKAIVDKHWMEIDYINAKNETTHFCCGIFDIDPIKNKIYADIFNAYKETGDVLSDPKPLSIDKIINANICEQTYYEVPQTLIDKVTTNKLFLDFLEVSELENNILKYLSDCYKMDNDPYLKETILLDDVYIKRLLYKKEYKLDNSQFKSIIDNIFKTNIFKAEQKYKYSELAINDLAIDINGKLYVVAFRHLELDFKTKKLKVSDHSTINKSFLIEDKRISLATYLDMDPEEFCKNYNKNKEEYINKIRENLTHGELINTAPYVFLLKKDSLKGVDEAFESIYKMQNESKTNVLPLPIKAFFGNNRSKGSKAEFNIVVFDKNKINRDQMRVIYNSMSKHTTYVQGPPGTGKTETIFNVLLSAYCNNKTVLVCSNNNHPVNDIFEKMSHSLYRKDYFSNDKKEIKFPIIRLGNKEQVKQSIIRLKEYLDLAIHCKNMNLNEAKTENSKNKVLTNFDGLRTLLTQYEAMICDQEELKLLNKISEYYDMPSNMKEKYNTQIEELKLKLQKYPDFSDSEFAKYVQSAAGDISFQNYIYYSSLNRIRKLILPSYQELKNIIETPDIDEAANLLGKYIKDDANLRKLLGVFPIVISTNLSSEKLGTPTPHFDLVIMDEAGQCNVAPSLIPIVRGNSLLLVGDTNQLQPVTVIEPDLNNKYKDVYSVSDDYDYVSNSILSTMLRKDSNSPKILLGYHYRCGRKIANFVNQRFYEQKLKLINKNEGGLTYINVKNEPIPDVRNAYVAEAKSIVNFIQDSKYQDIGIITPFRNQATLINFFLKKANITHCEAGTIHTLQGSEKSTIILSSAISLKTGKKTMDWVKNNSQLINVAVSRAKENLIFVGDKEAIDTLSKGENSDLKALSDYISKDGNCIVPKSENTIATDFSNNSRSEKLFFDTVTPYFARKNNRFQIERNVPVIKAIKHVDPEDLKRIGKKEFDVVIKVSGGFLGRAYNTLIVFEIDGGEHVGSTVTRKRDVIKAAICKKYGITLIRISNSEVRDYQLIINLFEKSVIKNMNRSGYEQIDLFEDYD